MTTNHYPLPGLQPPPSNPGIPTKTVPAAYMLIAGILFTGAIIAGLLIALTSHQTSSTQRDQAFLTVVHDKIADLGNTTDGTLVSDGHAICTTLSNGSSLLDAVDRIAYWTGITPLDAGYFVGAAIGAYCPSNAP